MMNTWRRRGRKIIFRERKRGTMMNKGEANIEIRDATLK
jgi:hypothetical protein